MHGDCRFAVAAANLCKHLPDSVRTAKTLPQYKTLLKTHLFIVDFMIIAYYADVKIILCINYYFIITNIKIINFFISYILFIVGQFRLYFRIFIIIIIFNIINITFNMFMYFYIINIFIFNMINSNLFY